jgi:hypothetical protein
MSLFATAYTKTASWPISVGAEGIAAAQFARCGFDVLVQSGHDKPWYDLVVTKAGNLLKVSVKASDDGAWSLTQSYLRRAADVKEKKVDCHRAIDLWLDCQGSRAVCCLVQFKGVDIDQLPRIYLASPCEVGQRLRETADRLGSSILQERYEWTSPETGMSAVEALPQSWLFSKTRIQELLSREVAEAYAGSSMPAKGHSSANVWSESTPSVRNGLTKVALTA